MCVDILPAWISMYHRTVWCPRWLEDELDTQELELPLVMNYLWVLEMEPQSSLRASAFSPISALSLSPTLL